MFKQGPLEVRDKLFSFRNQKRPHFQSFSSFFKIFFKVYLFIFLFLAVLGLCCCSGCALVVVCGLLTVMTSLVAKHGLQAHGLQSLQHTGSSRCSTRAQQVRCAASRVQARKLRRMGIVACGILLNRGSNPWTLHQQAGSLPLNHQGSPSQSS